MTDDLKRQASELYRERSADGPIPTSDALSMKKIFYITAGIAALLLVAVALFGGFRPRQDAIIAANTPPPLAKETPPADLLEQTAGGKTAPAPRINPQPASPAAPEPEPKRPEAKRDELPRAAEQPRTSAEVKKPALKRESIAAAAPAPAPAAPPVPNLSEVEVARREMAKDIVLEKNPTLAQLVASPNGKGWNAEPDGTDQYMVTFSVVDESLGAQVQYVWRVNMATRSITPLSYYARKLS